MHMKTCKLIHYSNKNPLASYKVCCVSYCYVLINDIWYNCLIFMEIKFWWISLGFLSVIIYEVYIHDV